MMIHISTTENRIAQFAALFEPYKDGYVYYGDRWLGGLPLSAKEHDHYIAHFTKVLRTGDRVTFGWVICAAIGLIVAEEGFHRQTENWQRALLFLLPFPWLIWTWWRSKHIVLAEIGRRTPVTPPRTMEEGVMSRVAAFPMALPVMMMAVGAVLLVQQWRYGVAASDTTGDALGVGIITFGAWILWVKRQFR